MSQIKYGKTLLTPTIVNVKKEFIHIVKLNNLTTKINSILTSIYFRCMLKDCILDIVCFECKSFHLFVLALKDIFMILHQQFSFQIP